MLREPHLCIIMYHYIRDLSRTEFPRLKAMLTYDFRNQVDLLSEQYEISTLETTLEFLAGKYQPKRNLCLLTFDDGFKEHYTEVLPILTERRIQGLFFPITHCLENHRVVSVHKNHFLMAVLGFKEYQQIFLKHLSKYSLKVDKDVDITEVKRIYRWDLDEVAMFKYILNFRVPMEVRNLLINDLFAEYLGDEAKFACQLYLNWEEVRQMQASGMLTGGHTHTHSALTTLSDEQQYQEMETCKNLLHKYLSPQTFWPFSYPFGKTSSFNQMTIKSFKKLGFCCSFTTEVGVNQVGQNRFCLKRIDPKDISL